jgi:hypothetical protein
MQQKEDSFTDVNIQTISKHIATISKQYLNNIQISQQNPNNIQTYPNNIPNILIYQQYPNKAKHIPTISNTQQTRA